MPWREQERLPTASMACALIVACHVELLFPRRRPQANVTGEGGAHGKIMRYKHPGTLGLGLREVGSGDTNETCSLQQIK